jgi:hypothetical protein
MKQLKAKTAYYEVHHIKMRSLGGNNEPENLVPLTPYEHYEVHKLAALIFSDYKWTFAWTRMEHSFTKDLQAPINPEEYNILIEQKRKAVSKIMKGHTKFRNTLTGKVKQASKGTDKYSELLSDPDYIIGGALHTEEYKKHMSELKTGIKRPDLIESTRNRLSGSTHFINTHTNKRKVATKGTAKYDELMNSDNYIIGGSKLTEEQKQAKKDSGCYSNAYKMTEEEKTARSIKYKNTSWYNNGKNNKRVKAEELDQFIIDNPEFVKGRIKFESNRWKIKGSV